MACKHFLVWGGIGTSLVKFSGNRKARTRGDEGVGWLSQGAGWGAGALFFVPLHSPIRVFPINNMEDWCEKTRFERRVFSKRKPASPANKDMSQGGGVTVDPVRFRNETRS